MGDLFIGFELFITAAATLLETESAPSVAEAGDSADANAMRPQPHLFLRAHVRYSGGTATQVLKTTRRLPLADGLRVQRPKFMPSQTTS